MTYIALAQSTETLASLNAWLTLIGEQFDEKTHALEDHQNCIIWKGGVSFYDAASQQDAVVRRIENAIRRSNIENDPFTVIVDTVRPHRLSAISRAPAWESLLARLILSFPEIRWLFGNISVVKDSEGEVSFPQKEHSIELLLQKVSRNPLLDPTGLRSWVRHITSKELEKSDDDFVLPVRRKKAAAIDEEQSFAYYHGYAAYRFGCNVDIITQWDSMLHFFGPSKAELTGMETKNPHDYWLLLEDMSLNFPDRESNKRLLRLSCEGEQGRSYHLSRLDSRDPMVEVSEHRVLITTGQQRPGDTTLQENRAYLRAKANGSGRIVFKPAGGIHDLWKKSGLLKKSLRREQRGNVSGFKWPPPPPGRVNVAFGHGMPGRLKPIADNLIRRCRTLANKDTETSILGAVLANDALELISCRTPTEALGALSLKHRFEIEAECHFPGVAYHVDLNARLVEIRNETGEISRWYDERQRKRGALNAETFVLNGVLTVLKEHYKFNEEQVCMNRIRYLHHTLWMMERKGRRLLWPILRYLDVLLSSFSIFIFALLGWILGLSCLFLWSANHPSWEYGFYDAVSSFFSMGAPIHHSGSAIDGHATALYISVVCMSIMSGFFHLGVFISHLYSIISRK